MKRAILVSGGFAIACLLAASSAHADEELEGMLEQHVVTAPTQGAEVASAAPATTSVITADDIHRHGIRTLDEALNYLSLGVFTTKPLHGHEVGARGVLMTGDYGNHVLLLVDGHRVNEPWGGAASFDRGLGVPIELIDHIEVVLGPGSVLYGSNAVLAVVHVVTKRARDWSGLRLVSDSDAFTWWKLGAGGGFTTDILGRRFEVTAQFEYQKQDGPTFTFPLQQYGLDSVTGEPKRFSATGPATGTWGGRADRSHYSRAPSAYLRVVSGDLEIALRASSYQRSSPYLDSLVNLTADFNQPNDYEIEKWLFADVKYRLPLSRVATIRTRAYADLYDYDWYGTASALEDCGPDHTGSCRNSLHGRSRWLGAEAQANLDWLTTGRLVTLLGMDGRVETIDGVGRSLPLGGGTPVEYGGFDVTQPRIGVYGQQTVKPTSWLSLNAGLRGDVADGTSAATPRGAASVQPWQGGTLKAIYAEAFRAPSTYERSYEDPYWLRGRNLVPEHVHSYEASFEQQLGTHRLMMGAFHTTYEKLVSLETATPDDVAAATADGTPVQEGAVAYKNAGQIRSVGYNAGVQGTLLTRRMRYGLNVTGAYARRETSTGTTPVTVAPSLFGNARVSYDLGGSLPTLALAAQLQGRRPTDRAFDSGYTIPPYASASLDVKAAVSGPVPLVKGLSYRLTGTYAFHDSGAYVIGVARDASFGLPPMLNPVDRFRVGVGLTYVLDP